MKKKDSLLVAIKKIEDLQKITKSTKYINLDITEYQEDIINYFIEHGTEYLYSDIIDNNYGYIYINYKEFINAENIMDSIILDMPKNLNDLEKAKYLYIKIAKMVFFDINIEMDKSETYSLSLINTANNLWGALSSGRVTTVSLSKIYYYLCKRLNINNTLLIDNDTLEYKNQLKIDNQVLITNLFKDIPYIQTNMQTKYFATYNNDSKLDKKINYIKSTYTDDSLDKELKNIDYTQENCIIDLLLKTQNIIDISNIKPVELSIIYQAIFNKYCPNYDIKINNLYLNKPNKNHFIIISYNNNHYSYNYKQKTFVSVNDFEIINNLKNGKIGIYQNELIPNINLFEFIENNC